MFHVTLLLTDTRVKKNATGIMPTVIISVKKLAALAWSHVKNARKKLS